MQQQSPDSEEGHKSDGLVLQGNMREMEEALTGGKDLETQQSQCVDLFKFSFGQLSW